MPSPPLVLPLLALSALQPAQEGPLLVVEGIARVVGTGEALPSASLSFSQGGHPESTVLTDLDGRFRWEPPPVLNLRARPIGEPGPNCRVLVQDPARWRLVITPDRPGPLAEHVRRSVEEPFFERAETRWERPGGRPLLVVECAPIGTSEILVLGPDGDPVAGRELELFPHSSGIEGAVARFSGRTDGRGIARIRWVEGLRRLRFEVPGVGFGSTGWFEVLGGKTARVDLPRLARFGEIAGRLAPGLLGKVEAVGIGDPYVPFSSRAEVDAEGRFLFRRVMPGTHRLDTVADDGPRIRSNQPVVSVSPGIRTEGVVLSPLPPADEDALRRSMQQMQGQRRGADPDEEITWVEGVVVDPAGRPIAGADLAAFVSFYGGMRIGGEVRTTTSGDSGTFRIAGPSLDFMGPFHIIAVAEGRPPAISFHPTPDPARQPGEDDRSRLELTLADRGGSAVVTVLGDGLPLPGATVRLSSDSSTSGRGWFPFPVFRPPGDRDPDPDELLAQVSPEATAGPDGVARFEHLIPGTYRISAAPAGENPDGIGIHRPGEPARTSGKAEGIPVVEARTTEHAIAVHPQPGGVRFRVLFPDGSPLTARASLGLQASEGGTSSFQLDEDGIGFEAFRSPGAYRPFVRFRDSATRSYPITREPYYEAVAQVAVTAALPDPGPIPMRAIRRGPASLRVQLLDTEGRPAPGTVLLVHPGMGAAVDHASTTDPGGLARFTDLPSGTYSLRAFLEGAGPIPVAHTSGFVPDGPLEGRSAVFGRAVELSSDDDVLVELRAEPVAYIEATIRTLGREAFVQGIGVPSDIPFDRPEVPHRLDREAGLVRAGPMPAGTANAWFFEPREGGGAQLGPLEIEVRPGLNRMELEPPGEVQEARPSRLPDELARLRVFLENGETPAFAAQASLFSPSDDQPTYQGIADASGRLSWKGNWLPGGGRPERAFVPVPTLVVRLPGSNGGVVLGLDRAGPGRVVLPTPMATSGVVTIGGRPVDGRLGRIRVVASREGVGVLNLAMGVETTASADGRFELRGLSPGSHLVQAIRDDLWASPAVELIATEEAPLPELTLDIPEPGAPVALTLDGPDGLPAADRPIRVLRPDGPLSGNWPEGLRTDLDGSIILRGLEAGTHRVAVEGEADPVSIEVPPIVPGQHPGPIAVRAVVGPPGG